MDENGFSLMSVCWKQMQSERFKDTPDERLRVYSQLANCACELSSGWTSSMLKAAQDPWSRIRKLACDALCDSIKDESTGKQKGNQAQHLLGLLLERWSKVEDHWYAKEGILLLFRRLVFLVPEVVQKALIALILVRVMLPSLCYPQLPVRNVAVEFIVESSLRSKELTSFILDSILDKIEGQISAVGPSEDFQALDGFLSSLAKILNERRDSLGARKTRLQRCLLHLGVHPAASVRQCVAETWASRNTESFETLLSIMIQKSRNPSDTDDWWRMVETVLMALQELLTRLLSVPGEIVVLGVEVQNSIADSLYAVLLFSESNKFEVARMGKQVLPLLTQMWVRFAPSLFFLRDCCGKVATRFRSCKHFFTLFLPGLVWFLTIRRHVALGESEIVVAAVKNFIVPIFRTENINDEDKNDKQGIQQVSAVLAPVAAILLYTYFADCCGAPVISLALSKKAWDMALNDDLDNIRFAVDFTSTVRRGSGTVGPLLESWLNRIDRACTHQQCLAIEAAKVAVGTSAFCDSMKLFSFAYNSHFDAPTIQDGGENVSRGFNWLKQHYPFHSAVPAIQHAVHCFCEKPCEASIPSSIHDIVYTRMYLSKLLEPVVVHAVQSLMLLECEAEGSRGVTAFIVAGAVIARLESIAPTWRSTLSGEKSDGKNRSCTFTENIDKTCAGGDHSFNDWDDSDGEGVVEGTSVEREIENAAGVLSAIVEKSFSGDRGGFLKAAGHLMKDAKILLGC